MQLVHEKLQSPLSLTSKLQLYLYKVLTLETPILNVK